MSVALLVLRVIVGALFAGHGSQKLFGWFKGYGLAGTGAFFESIGLAGGTPLALLAGVAELAGGALLGFGFLLPVACLLLTGVMAAAVATVHWKKGLWVTEGGFEYPLVMAAVAFAVAAIGPGSISLDNAFGIDWASLEWAATATVVGALGAWAAVGQLELVTGAGGLRETDPFRELLQRQAPVDHRALQHLDRTLALGVAGEDRRLAFRVGHTRQR